jgi:type 1 fimbria pilin
MFIRFWRQLFSFLLIISFGYSTSVISALPKGYVNMKGSIVETACSIATGSVDQTVIIATLPVSYIINNGQSSEYGFSINLVNCVLEHLSHQRTDEQYFSITFEGDNDSGLFGVKGEAKGIALKISDARGNVVIPGEALPAEPLSPGTMVLNYILRLVSDGKILRSGNYNAAIRFRIDYL